MSSSSSFDRKLEHWRQNLLDMTFRNRMLNFRPRSAVRMVRPDARAIFDLLVRDERMLTVRELSEEDGAQPADSIIMNAGEVLPAYGPRGLTDDLRRMRLRARAHLQEQGANILFMAFGMVRWYETPKSSEELLSPLVMVPVELLKEGPARPFKVRASGDDITVNPNLMFKLSTEYWLSLPEWPEEPMDLEDYLLQVRGALSEMPRWKVDADAYLGLFSFSKLSMYRELEDQRPRLAAHPFINALAGDHSLLPMVPEHPTADTLDAAVRPSDTFQVLDADSSQQEAVEMSKRGISFVLQGPPGTGKSQTITNIIAEALAADRTVLFVSEKMAALEVVKKRLDEKGLGDYCLEIHSRKVSKSAVMDELRRSMMPLPVETAPSDDLQRLERTREELNGYVDALHRPRGRMERSAYYVYGRLAALEGMPDLPVQVPDVMSVGLSDLDDRLRLVRRVESMRGVVEGMDQHPWRDLRTSGWMPGNEVVVGISLQKLRDAISRLSESCAKISAMTGMNGPSNLDDTRTFIGLLGQASRTPFPEVSWISAGRPERLLSDISQLEEMRSKLAFYRKWSEDNYNGDVITLEAESISARFESRYRTPLRVLSGEYRKDIASLRGARRTAGKLRYADAAADLRRLVTLRELERRVVETEGAIGAEIGPRFRGKMTDWDEVAASLRWTSEFIGAAGHPLAPQLIAMLSDRGGRVRDLRLAVEGAEAELGELEGSLEWLGNNFMLGPPEELRTMPFERLDQWAADHLAAAPSMKEWIEVSALARSCRENGLGEIIDLGRRGALPPADLAGAYEKRAFKAWLDQAYHDDPVLKGFNGDEHARAVALFRRLDERQMEIAQRRLRNLLNVRREQALRPQGPISEELASLRHETAKKKRFKQIRQLFRECPGIIQALKPCLLMSPISVSQYLDPEALGFDLVIFDEASQVRPEDAIGSIMRAKQVIVVGDGKQLPPTSFFRGEAGEEEDMEDLESILDECSAINIKQHMLLWHYRSRHESLIAFSNRRFYGGRLFTFPSSGREEGEWGVSFTRVQDGIYDRSGTRTNVVEARKVAELVFDHFSATPERSLGVIAFSEAQQMAIIDQLDTLRRQRPEFERFFAEGDAQEFFVKNLENVQGDERDVMIFSVGYGRDAQGRMHQNFGPLNKAGGERRLNVAITRARMHVKLVASIGADDIDGSSSVGTRLLKDYISFAASGGRQDIVQAGHDRKNWPNLDPSLEDDVHRALVAEGMRVHRQVGCSGYRIDLAVEDPARPGTFLLGIECDGNAYRSGKTARDRDRIRESVLRGLGWNIHRIWSKEWVEDRSKEIEKVKKALAAADGASRAVGPGISHVPGTGAAPNDFALEKETFLPAFLDLVKERGPVHRDVARDVLDGHVHRPEDVERALSERLYALTKSGAISLKDGFIWSAQMSIPPIRRPEGREPMDLGLVALEEIAEAELYCMGENDDMAREELIERTAAFYRYESIPGQVRVRLELAAEHLVRSGRLVSQGKGRLRRAR